MGRAAPPERILTPRLVLRRWEVSDAPRLRAAIDASLPELVPFIPWAAAEPTTVDEVAVRLGKFHDGFAVGPDHAFGIFDRGEGELIGGIGLHARVGPDAIEVGYWIRSDCAGQGYGTEATAALTQVALALGVRHVQLHCDVRNAGSARVAEKAGFRHATTRPGSFGPTGEMRDLMIWVYPPEAEPWQPPEPAE